MAKCLVIKGDDFGAHHAHNSGVVKAFTEGIMTTAGIITASPWFAEAVKLAKEYSIPWASTRLSRRDMRCRAISCPGVRRRARLS